MIEFYAFILFIVTGVFAILLFFVLVIAHFVTYIRNIYKKHK
jgi:hypothetical protein